MFKILQLFNEDVLYRRNERMATRMDEMIRADPSQVFFFAFGALHFHGERSVQDVLEKKYGYQIRPVFEGDEHQIIL